MQQPAVKKVNEKQAKITKKAQREVKMVMEPKIIKHDLMKVVRDKEPF